MKICRLCLSEGDETKIISVLNHNDTNIREKIQNCVSITISVHDDLPTSVCMTCMGKIQNWIDFKENCLKVNEMLLNTHYQRPQCYQKIEDNDSKHELDSNGEEAKLELVEAKNIGTPNHTYDCDICDQKFNNCLEYLDHQPTHDGSAVFKCDKCSKVFTSREKLVEHDINHLRPCTKCGKMILKNSMKLHLIKHTDRHMCSQCKNRFNSRAALFQHIITIHTDRKDHICESCGKRFSSKTAMTVHLKSHGDERLYHCKLCDYSGRTASAVYVHMSTHSKEVCVCEVCSKIFKSTRNLNDHLRRVHSKEKRHQCKYCDKKFVDKYMLTVHVRCHTGVRPYQCKLCDKAFIRSDGLKEHMATHGQRVWFECNTCNKKFASKKGLGRHNCAGNKKLQ